MISGETKTTATFDCKQNLKSQFYDITLNNASDDAEREIALRLATPEGELYINEVELLVCPIPDTSPATNRASPKSDMDMRGVSRTATVNSMFSSN